MVRPAFPLRARLAMMAGLSALILCLATAVSARQPGSLLLWPVNPVIPADARAAALWLENPGAAPITLQVRVFAWAQADGKDVYAPQNDIVGTPPLVTIQPGAKQLVRLTRTVPAPAAGEVSYRVVVDEIPTRENPVATGAAVSFRMRYSLPLFVHGPDVTAAAKRPGSPQPGPVLGWRIHSDGKARFLEIRNSGPIHARLVDAAFTVGGQTRSPVAPGLLGYVLPGSTVRWKLAEGTRPTDVLVASVNGTQAVVVARLVE